MRIALYIVGWIATALGALGAVLPLLPATPFLLLAAACFAKSSPGTREWLLRAPLLGPILTDYLEHRVVTRRTKAVALLLMWPAIAFAAVSVPLVAVSVLLFAIAAAVTIYLLRLPSRMMRTPPPGLPQLQAESRDHDRQTL